MTARSLARRTSPCFHRVVSILLTGAGLAALGSAQSTWYVDVNAVPPGDGSESNPYRSLQYCISQPATLPGDRVLVLPGQYDENIDYLGKSLAIESTAGSGSTTIRVTDGSVVRVVTGEGPGTTLQGFSLRWGRGELEGNERIGGGLLCRGTSLTVRDCSISSNFADRGAGVYADGFASLELIDCGITQNWGTPAGGGIYAVDTDVLIQDSHIVGNWVDGVGWTPGRGGGLWISGGSLTVFDSEIVANYASSADSMGGGVFCMGSAHFERCNFQDNGVGYMTGFGSEGGAVWGSGFFRDCNFIDNVAFNGFGGGVNGGGTFIGCIFQDNSAFKGGALLGGGTMTDCLITENRAYATTGECTSEGGGVIGGSYVNCVISNNYAGKVGGGALQATLIDCIIEDNGVGSCVVLQGGGGIAHSTATGCTLRRNRVYSSEPIMTGAPAGGGAAYASTLDDCLIIDNAAIGSGGWTYSAPLVGGGTYECTLTNCVVRDNHCQDSAEQGGKGGGIYGGTAIGCLIEENQASWGGPGPRYGMGGGAAMAELTRCTILRNEADKGAGVWASTATHCVLGDNQAQLSGGAVSGAPPDSYSNPTTSLLKNCILWENEPNEVSIEGGTVQITYSAVAGGYPGAGNISEDPLLWNLSAGDVHLRVGSPCIDAGDPSSPPDGDGSRADMGVFPFDITYCGDPYVYCEAKMNSQGCVPAIGHTGTPTRCSENDFYITAEGLINRVPAILIWSRAPAETPFGGGTLCLAPPVVRTPHSWTGGSPSGVVDCSGEASFFFSHYCMSLWNLVPGDRVYAQYWYRDPFHTDGTGFGLTDALDFTISL